MVVGVLGEGGQILNDNGRDFPGFVVSKRRSQFKIQLRGIDRGKLKNVPSRPIVIASPHWYTNGKNTYPENIAQISLAVEASSDEDDEFAVRVGSYSKTGSQVGMNFIALDPTFEDDSFVFGHVGSSEKGTDVQGKWESYPRSDSVHASTFLQNELCDMIGNDAVCPALKDATPTGSYSGVEIKFTKSFVGLPAVIITPVINAAQPECGSDTYDGFIWTTFYINVPHCSVETIGQDSIFVKCGCVKITNPGQNNAEVKYEGLPFNFLAVGPVEAETKNGDLCNSDSSCSRGQVCLKDMKVCSDGMKFSPCDSNESCHSLSGCDLLDSNTCKKSCSADGNDCFSPDKFLCSITTDGERGACLKKGTAGDNCDDDFPCAESLQCLSGKCSGGSIGDTCMSNTDCNSDDCWLGVCISMIES